jgi:radical SAM protein with 4Fe4S-binding SPASM domain
MRSTPYLSIIITVKNNARTLADAVSDIRRDLGRFGRPYEIIMADDASTDDSENIGRKLAARASHIKYLRLGESGEYSLAVRTGIDVAEGSWVLCTTADGSHDFRDIRELLTYTGDYDLISGYRPVRNQTGYDRLVCWVRKVLFKWRFGYVPKEGQCGLRLVKREIFREIPLQRSGTGIDYELLYRSIRAGFRHVQIPVHAREAIPPEGLLAILRIFLALHKAYPRIGKIRNLRRKGRGRIGTYLRRQWCMLSDRPIEASLAISGRCDLQCISCDIWSEPIRSEKDTAFWVGIIDDLYRLGVRQVMLIGGEPLMRDDIGRIIRAISVRGMATSIFTNGFRLLQRAAELVDAGLDRLVLSIDGPEPAVHDGLRGGGGIFDVAMEGLEKVRNEASSKGLPVPEVVFHTTVSVANAHTIPDMFAFAHRHGANTVLQAICQAPRAIIGNTTYQSEKIASRQYMISDLDLLLSRDIALRVRQKIRHNLLARYNLSAKTFLSLSEEHLLTGTFPVIPCGHVHNTLSVNSQGAMYPCGMLANFHYASLDKTTSYEAWKGQRRKVFLETMKQNPFPVCKYCCHYLNNLTPGQAARVMIGLPLK